MIEHVQFVFDRDTGRLKIADSPHDLPVLHIAGRIVITTNDEESWVPASCGLNQPMENIVVLMISRHEYKAVFHGVKKVTLHRRRREAQRRSG